MKIFVDTNYFLRFLLEDNKKQANEVRDIFTRASEGEIELSSSLVVFFELYWVLNGKYEMPVEEIISLLEKVLMMVFITFPDREILFDSLRILKERPSLQLEDCYNISWFKAKKLEKFMTFDKKLHNYINQLVLDSN